MKPINFFKFATISIFGQGIGILVPFIVGYFFIPSEFASFSLGLMISSFFLSFLINPTQTPYVIQAIEERGRTEKINETFTVQCIAFAISIIIAAFLFLIFGSKIALFSNIANQQVFALFLAYLGLAIKSNVASYFLSLEHKNMSALVELLFNVTSILCIIIAFLTGHLSLLFIFFTYFMSGLSVIILFILKVEYRLITPLSFKKSAALQLFNFSKWQIFGLTAAFLVNWGDNIVLRQYSNLHDIGIYNFAYQIFKGTVTASFIIYSYFLTFITKNIKNKEIIQTYLKKTRPILLFLSIGILGFLFLLIYLLTEKIYGIEYLGVIPLTGILLIATCLAVYSVFYIAIFNALKKYAVVQIILIVQISINLFLDIVFVPRFGIYGAAMATVIGYGFALIMYEYYFQKKISKNLLS